MKAFVEVVNLNVNDIVTTSKVACNGEFVCPELCEED